MSRAVILSVFLASSIVCLASCSRHVGASIELPEIPPPTAGSPDSRARFNTSVSLSGFKDVREAILPGDEFGTERYTQPQGAVSQQIEAAMSAALTEKGLVVSGAAPISLWGEVRRWRTLVSTTATSKIQSEAALYVELLDASGKRLYSGTFHGSRASQFPVATAEDIKTSLGVAMAQAISQVLEDEEFLQALLQ